MRNQVEAAFGMVKRGDHSNAVASFCQQFDQPDPTLDIAVRGQYCIDNILTYPVCAAGEKPWLCDQNIFAASNNVVEWQSHVDSL